jgi:hypothetical protein
MTAAGNSGASTPENDDPFAYLYRSEGGDGDAGGAAAGGPAQPGVPRTSYHQVGRVGERRYGQQAAQQQAAGPGQPPNGPQRTAHYAAPETLPGGPPRRPAPSAGRGRGRGGGQGPNSKGLLIGAIAVVAAVVIGISVAMFSNDTEGDQGKNPSTATPTADASGDQQAKNSSGEEETEPEKPFSSEQEDAAALRLDGGAAVASDIEGARSQSGSYVTGMNAPGASATWSVDVPKDGQYTLFVGYGVPGKDADATLVVNGKPRSEPQKLKNYAGASQGDWAKGWTYTYAWLDLEEGTNTLQLMCGPGNQCDFALDYVQLKAGQVKD